MQLSLDPLADALKRHFGHDAFRPGQRQVIEAVPACADPAPVAAGAWYPSLALPVAPFGTTRGFTTEPTSNGTIHPRVNKRPTRLLGTTPT